MWSRREDVPQLENRVDLDPKIKDIYGLPVARITYSPHASDKLASWYWARKLQKIIKAAGAETSYFYPTGLGFLTGTPHGNTSHIGGTLRMGTDRHEFGRIHGAANVVIADGSVFPTFSAVNPTLTIMAVALRSITTLAHGDTQARRGPSKADVLEAGAVS